MTKKQFMEIIDRTANAIADGGQGGIEDVLTISKVLGGCDLELRNQSTARRGGGYRD